MSTKFDVAGHNIYRRAHHENDNNGVNDTADVFPNDPAKTKDEGKGTGEKVIEKRELMAK